LPIVEGGSWFYTNHLFTGLTETFKNNQAYQESKLLA